MIEIANRKPNVTKEFSFLSYPYLSEQQKQQFDKIAVEMMRIRDY